MKLTLGLAPETQKKLIKSLQIGSAGFLVGTIGILMADPTVIAWLVSHPIVSMALASYLPVLLNGINEWRKNAERVENL